MNKLIPKLLKSYKFKSKVENLVFLCILYD